MEERDMGRKKGRGEGGRGKEKTKRGSREDWMGESVGDRKTEEEERKRRERERDELREKERREEKGLNKR